MQVSTLDTHYESKTSNLCMCSMYEGPIPILIVVMVNDGGPMYVGLQLVRFHCNLLWLLLPKGNSRCK